MKIVLPLVLTISMIISAIDVNAEEAVHIMPIGSTCSISFTWDGPQILIEILEYSGPNWVKVKRSGVHSTEADFWLNLNQVAVIRPPAVQRPPRVIQRSTDSTPWRESPTP